MLCIWEAYIGCFVIPLLEREMCYDTKWLLSCRFVTLGVDSTNKSGFKFEFLASKHKLISFFTSYRFLSTCHFVCQELDKRGSMMLHIQVSDILRSTSFRIIAVFAPGGNRTSFVSP